MRAAGGRIAEEGSSTRGAEASENRKGKSTSSQFFQMGMDEERSEVLLQHVKGAQMRKVQNLREGGAGD